MKGQRLLAAVAVCASILLTMPGAHAGIDGCASTPSSGGDWPMYGHDHSNSRFQTAETKLSPANVGTLVAAWTFSTAPAGGGAIIGTPVEADGCVFFGTDAGAVVALNADTGALAWTTKINSGVYSSVTVADGKVFANESIVAPPYTVGPRVIALDEATGAQL